MAFKGRNAKRHASGAGPTATVGDAETYVIYGVMPVLEILRASAGRIRKIAVSNARSDQHTSEILDVAKRSGVPVNRLARSEIAELVPAGVNHQGIAAFVKTAEYASADDIIKKAENDPNAMFLVLDGIEDPRNLGAILRTAECAGVTGIFLPERRAAGLTDTAVKSAAGAAALVDVAKVKNQNRLIEELKSKGIWVVGAAGDGELEYSEWDFCQKTAIVLGSEGKGLHRLTAEKCDILVKIPMSGRISSLNVSVAAGVLLYEAVRQRKLKKV